MKPVSTNQIAEALPIVAEIERELFGSNLADAIAREVNIRIRDTDLSPSGRQTIEFALGYGEESLIRKAVRYVLEQSKERPDPDPAPEPDPALNPWRSLSAPTTRRERAAMLLAERFADIREKETEDA